MFYTYALNSLERNYIYVGITSDIERRVKEHNLGKNKTTRPYRPFVLIFKKEFKTRLEARVEEIKLKSGYGKEFLKNLIHNQKNQKY
ncbi:Excinuclease ABC C subunit domain protein [Allomuricauda ruestringensis DSM 13258]|uniref:Excinuclease ABC C subunit domain protein n=1 Tax=Allomuricauda ruestringensis (strain DSM 13258 / CIP 107369 / LMG 19739 / B1) TaxID=886377 RepID=G2PJY8_ALLRU|nr:GIY-YIG nuclease family protein [Allomuricauda ruestringensis]AEM70943.1 Excinuclease ABC C subunit domain protein [Allomuricauda ruestringensis DSM 13258]